MYKLNGLIVDLTYLRINWLVLFDILNSVRVLLFCRWKARKHTDRLLRGLFDDIWAQITTNIELPCIDCQRLVADVYRHGHGWCVATLRCLYWLYLERILGLNWRWCHNSMILRLLARLLQSEDLIVKAWARWCWLEGSDDFSGF